jgi:hypothetical protein
MNVNTYQVTGLTHKVTANTSSSETSFTVAEAGTNFAGQTGPIFLKITNGSSTQNIFFSTGTTSQTAVAPTGSGANAGSCCIPAFAEVFVQVAAQSNTPTTIYVACVAAASSPVYITPVTLVG